MNVDLDIATISSNPKSVVTASFTFVARSSSNYQSVAVPKIKPRNNNQKEFFRDNRHDQSILSVSRKIHGSLVLPEETWFESFGCENSLKYPFWATRDRFGKTTA